MFDFCCFVVFKKSILDAYTLHLAIHKLILQNVESKGVGWILTFFEE